MSVRTQKAGQCILPHLWDCGTGTVSFLEGQLVDYFLFGMTSCHWEIFFRRFEGTHVSHCEGSEVLIGPLNP